jgi:ribosomal protein S18 acetylase RimI-like enzyme
VFGSYPYLKLLGVDPSFSNQGIGGQLLQHVEQHIMDEGGQELFLLVSSGNLGAQRFYERHGYLQIGTIPELGGPKFTELLFRKQLVSLA